MVLRQHGGQYIGYFTEDTIYGDGLLLLASGEVINVEYDADHDT